MTINLTDPANHPANGPLTVERITRVRDELQRSLDYQNGGDMAYVIADAIKGLEELMKMRSFTESADRARSFEFEPVRFTPAYATPTEPVMYCSQETIAASKDGEHLLRTLSSPSGDCIIPLYTAASVIADSWIPVSERMPLQLSDEDVDGVDVIVTDGIIVGKCECRRGYLPHPWVEWSNYGDIDAKYITHWQPLPAAPQEVK